MVLRRKHFCNKSPRAPGVPAGKGQGLKSIKRRTVFFLFGLLGLLLSVSPCLAETARDITAEAKITASTHLPSSVRVSDRDFGTIWNSLKGGRENLEIETAEP